ncbi:MAG: OmpA family protein [Bacteroidota bacterium]
MKQFLLLIVSILSIQLAFCQSYTTTKNANSKEQKKFKEAKEEAFRTNYEDALKIVDKLLKSKPDFIDAWILKGQILYDQKRLDAAKEAFQHALQIDQNYSSMVYYMLGAAEMNLENYEVAAKQYEAYIAQNPKDKRRVERAKKYVSQAKFRASMLANPVPFDPQSLSKAINTPTGEFLPALTADGEMLLFTRRIGQQEDFYFSKLENGEWQTAQPLDQLNTPQNEGALTISADGRIIIFGALYRQNTVGNFDLYFSELRDGKFIRPINLGTKVNSSAMDRQPTLSGDGNTLYFESKRSGGQGESDIWKSERQKDGSWGKAENLGAIVNTKGIDKAPFIHADGRTLYFMSNVHQGMGGFDLFVTRKQADGTWSEPENLGYPINTKANQGALFISLDGKTAYYTSDQAPPEYGGREDIYTFEIPEDKRPDPVTYVKATVRDATTKRRIKGAEAEFIALEKASVFAKAATDHRGLFLTVLPMGENYALNVSHPDYLFHSENFELTEIRSLEKPFELDVFLNTIPKAEETLVENKPIVLRNIFFETGKATLLDASLIELQRLKRLLENNPNLRIQINGHTDNVGSEEDNLALSQARAKAVQDYLIEQNIEVSRIQHKGFGESQPIDTNETAKGRQSNRRTEFMIIK